MNYLFALLPLVLICSTALANEPQKTACNQPTIPQPLASDLVIKYFDKHVLQYKACITKFVDEQTAISKTSTDVAVANAAHDAAEAAIKESNDFIAAIDERNSHTQQGDQ